MITIPHIRAQTFIRKMPNAHTRPGLFLCRTADSQYQEYLVKYCRQLGGYIVCEFLAALLGHHLGLPIPPIAIVDIDPRVVTAITCPDTFQMLAEDSGPHFGSLFYSGGYTLPFGAMRPEMIPQALEIFAFDMLIQNPDRSNKPNQGKPNMLVRGDQLIIIDHEKAFSFVAHIGTPPPPWELRTMPWVTNHIFYGLARKHASSFAAFCQRLRTISDAFLKDMKSALPKSWYDPNKVDKIVSQLVTVRDNVDRFERGLLEALV